MQIKQQFKYFFLSSLIVMPCHIWLTQIGSFGDAADACQWKSMMPDAFPNVSWNVNKYMWPDINKTHICFFSLHVLDKDIKIAVTVDWHVRYNTHFEKKKILGWLAGLFMFCFYIQIMQRSFINKNKRDGCMQMLVPYKPLICDNWV